MKQILVSGSSAYDTIVHFDGLFSTSLEGFSNGSEKDASTISTNFDRNHGGTGANICYNLALLGESSILLSSVGDDFSFSGLVREKTNLKYVHKQDLCHSSNSIIISDNKDNRMTVFHPGAMNYASESKISYVQEGLGIAIVSANHISTMLQHARDLKEKQVKFFIDPAQQITQMSQSDLQEIVSLGNYLIVNQSEYIELQERSGMSENNLQSEFEILIVTHGRHGSDIYSGGDMIHVPAIEVTDIVDSTGAGDAYRAGILYGLIEGYDIVFSSKLGTVLASYAVVAPGSQQHHFSLGGVIEDMKQYFGEDIDLFTKRKY